MAQWEILEHIDLQKLSRKPSFYRDALLTPGDKDSHKLIFMILKDGVQAEISGTAYAIFKRADGYKVHAEGTVSDNMVSIVIPPEACNFPGMLNCRVKLDSSLQTITLCDILFQVKPDYDGDSVLTSEEIVLSDGVISYDGIGYYDVSGTTATESDVRDGKLFRQADGTIVEGNADFAVTVDGLSVTAQLVEGEDYEIIVTSGGN